MPLFFAACDPERWARPPGASKSQGEFGPHITARAIATRKWQVCRLPVGTKRRLIPWFYQTTPTSVWELIDGRHRSELLTYSAKKNGARFVDRVCKGNVMEVSLPAFSAFSPFWIIFRL